MIEAVKALVAEALPNADVKRHLAKSERIPPGGPAVVRDGGPGEPEVLLSPPTDVYTHRVSVEVAAWECASPHREAVR